MDMHNVFDVSVTDHTLAITFNDFIYFYNPMSKIIHPLLRMDLVDLKIHWHIYPITSAHYNQDVEQDSNKVILQCTRETLYFHYVLHVKEFLFKSIMTTHFLLCC